jgi:hypothetical protein
VLNGRRSLLAAWNLLHEQGLFRTIRLGRPVAPDGTPIPWFTYPAIAFLDQFDLSQLDVFEYGSGYSTLYWQSRAKSVVSIEHDSKWYSEMSVQVDHVRVDYRLVESADAYVRAIEAAQYDIVVIDGVHRDRCVAPAVAALRPGGLVVLDNADWFPELARSLRDSGLLEVDFTGLGPINSYTWTTSFFVSRDANLTPLGHQPRVGHGGLVANVSTTRAAE